MVCLERWKSISTRLWFGLPTAQQQTTLALSGFLHFLGLFFGSVRVSLMIKGLLFLLNFKSSLNYTVKPPGSPSNQQSTHLSLLGEASLVVLWSPRRGALVLRQAKLPLSLRPGGKWVMVAAARHTSANELGLWLWQDHLHITPSALSSSNNPIPPSLTSLKQTEWRRDVAQECGGWLNKWKLLMFFNE